MTATVAHLLARADELRQVSESPRLDTELLLAAAVNKDRSWLYTWPDKTLEDTAFTRFNAIFARRKQGEPIAYILGEKEFWSLPLYVDQSTLIPRPETELLVEAVLQQPIGKQRILDLGTGTGAIALALASELSMSDIYAVDASSAAIELAKRNCRRLSLENVTIFASDWFSELAGMRFDIIVSNPPYIDADDTHLVSGDLRFEPKSALVAAKNGLADIATIIAESREHLTESGMLLLEHGWQQAEAVRSMFSQNGYREIDTLKDLSGNDRVTFAKV